MFHCFRILIVAVISVVLRIYSYFFVKPRKNCIPPIDNEILLKPAVILANDIREGKLKSKDVVEIYLRRIQSVNRFINAVVDQNKNAVKEAEAIDEMVRRQNAGEESSGEASIHDMPLLGVPVSTKDSVAIKGLLLSAGFYARRNTIADEDADIIKNLRKAGAIPIALTNVPELLMWSDSTNCTFGVTRNPYDLSRSPGGSTGGDAALISSAGSVIGMGTDIAGSIRNPSFRCGIFGHKVTPKVMPRNGFYPEINDLLNPLFTSGPMCRYTVDLIPTLKAAAGDSIRHLPLIDSTVDLSTLKIYYMFGSNTFLKRMLSTDMKQSMEKVITHFEQKYNIHSVMVDFEEFRVLLKIYMQLFTRGCDYHAMLSNGGPKINLITELLKAVIGLSEHAIQPILFASVAKFDPNFDESNFELLEKLKKKFYNMLKSNGILLYPSGMNVAPNLAETYVDAYSFIYTCFFNALGVPVTQCPLGINKDGLPLGVQVVGAPYNDHLTLAVAKELESAFGGWVPPCQIKV